MPMPVCGTKTQPTELYLSKDIIIISRITNIFSSTIYITEIWKIPNVSATFYFEGGL